MFNQIYTQIHTDIFKKSPWEDGENETTDNIFTKSRKKNKFLFNFNEFYNKFSFNTNIMLLVLLILAAVWLVSGVYEIKEGEESAVMRFGKFARKGSPGLNYHLPPPFERAIIEKVNQSRRIEIGYRSTSSIKANVDNSKAMATESAMLTGDENIVALNCDVMWHISDLEKYIFNIVNPEDTVKMAAESAIREVIGNTPISSILSDQKQEITNKIELLTQRILNHYQAGVGIEKVQLLKAEPPAEVIDAYRDVQTSKADKEREINQAQSYNNDVLPKARGQAAKILQEAEGYKQEIIAKAEGDTKRFTAIYSQYMANKSITRERLYLETMENILAGTSKVIMGANGVLPHMLVQQNKSKE